MAQVVGQRTTYQTSSGQENRWVRHIDEKIAMLEPEIAPLITLLNKLKKRRAIDSVKHEWMEDDYTARWAQNSSTTVNATTSATTFTAADGTLFVPGDIVVVPNTGSTSVGERMRVTTVSSNVVTVTRNWDGGGITTLNGSAYFRIIGTAWEEGGDVPLMKSTAPATKVTYLQIFKKGINYTNTQIAHKVYGSQAEGERKRQQMKALKEFKIDLNSALLWSSAYESLTGGTGSRPIRQTMGVNSVISTNVTDANGILTRRTFESWAANVFRYESGKERVLLAAPKIVSAINEWGTSFLNVEPAEKVLGVQIQKIHTGHGTFALVRDWMLENPTSTATGFGGLAFALDLDQIEYLYLSGNGESRDTQLQQDVVKDGSDRKVDQIIGEIGFAVKNEKYHGKLYNVTGYAA